MKTTILGIDQWVLAFFATEDLFTALTNRKGAQSLAVDVEKYLFLPREGFIDTLYEFEGER